MARWIQLTGTGAAGLPGTPGPPGPSGGLGTPAPNILSATLTVTYEPWASLYQFRFSGTITLPTADPHYAELTEIHVEAYRTADGTGRVTIAILKRADWGLATTVDYTGPVAVQPDADENWSCDFVSYNTGFTPTAPPYTITPILIHSAGILSVSGVEVGPHYQDPATQGLHTVIGLGAVLTTPSVPANVTFWVKYGSADWVRQGVWLLETVGQLILIGQKDGATVGTIWVPTSSAKSTWYVAGALGNVTSVDPPAGAPTATFTVASVLPPTPNDITNAQFFPSPATGDILQYYHDDTGTWWWDFYDLEWLQPELSVDSDYWFSFVSLKRGYVDGSGVWNPSAANDPETPDDDLDLYIGHKMTDSGQIQGGRSIPGSTIVLKGDSPADWPMPPEKNLDGSPKLDRTWRFYIYAVSRLGSDEDGSADAAAAIVLQHCWPGGADHFDVTPSIQPAAQNLNRINPITSAKAIPESVLADNAASARVLASSSVTFANAALGANAVVDSNVATTSIGKLIPGTVVFNGDVSLARGNGQAVLTMNNAGLYLFSAASAAGSGVTPGVAGSPSYTATGLTSQPYVGIQASGIGVFQSATGPSVVTTGTSVVLYAVNGSLLNPYCAIANTGIKLRNGDQSLMMNAGVIQIWSKDGDNTKPVISIDSTSVTIQNGTNQLVATASDVRLLAGSSSIIFNSAGVAEFIAAGGTSNTIILGGDIITVNVSASKVSVNTGGAVNVDPFDLTCYTYATASSSGSITMPTHVAGFIQFTINGSHYKIPYVNP